LFVPKNAMTTPILFADLTAALMPIYLLGLGTLAGLVVLLALYAACWLAFSRVAETARSALGEGFLLPVLSLAGFLGLLSVLGVAFGQVPLGDLMKSLAKLPVTGVARATVEIPAGADRDVLDLDIRPAEVAMVEITSDAPLELLSETTSISLAVTRETRFELNPNEPWRWQRRSATFTPFVGEAAQLLVINPSDRPAQAEIVIAVRPEYPEVAAIPWTAGSLIVLVLGYLALRLLLPKISAIASTTAKEGIVQPIFKVLVILGVVFLLLFVIVPYNTFGEDVKILKDTGLTLIKVLAIIMAVWTASVSVAEEIEGRTALTVLSKPIGRRQFVLGKFFGILQPVALMFLFLGALFLLTVSYKVVYDARESALPSPTWQQCYVEMITTVPGLFLAFLEAMVLASISVAISTRLPMMANMLICLSVYLLGHLVPMLVQSAVGRFEIVQFVGRFLATILPVLDTFDIQAAISKGEGVPLDYLGWVVVYSALYSTVAMLLALAMFEDRDLA
jgi:ABC-type transport system involved in multi-copper enzyme maturation permease subunit